MTYRRTINPKTTLITSNSSFRGSVSVDPTPPPVVTCPYLDDTIWTVGEGAATWNSVDEQWEVTSANPWIRFDPINGWEVGFRPAKMFITLIGTADIGGTFTIQLQGSPGTIVYENNITVPAVETTYELDLSFAVSDDIVSLFLRDNTTATYEITCIDFEE